ncbi:glycosyltransferase family 2 protein [Cohnella cholangitidis]|nr:glycosyltransferase [Cohnella cholangitidis]
MTGPEKKKLVSIIIPIYNGERYIEETIRNVLNQTYTELEVLCIIDGTTDESANIIRRLGDDRVKIVMQENSGATRTRNRGLSMATGEFILFLDQDDVIKPEFIELTVREIIRTNSSGVAVNGHLIDSDGKIIRRMYRVNKPKLTLKSLLKGNQMYTPSQVLLRREKLAEIGAFDVKADQADDWDMWIRHARSGKLVFLDRYLMGYRMHDANQSLNRDKMLRSELHIVERKLADIGKAEFIKSYSYMRYSKGAGDWNALAKAVQLNGMLVLKPRFYVTLCQVALRRRKIRKEGG